MLSFLKKNKAEKKLIAFVSGRVIPIEEVPDETFAGKILGDGIAIEPSNQVLVAPADGEILVVMSGSNHACGMKLADGMEIMLHIGLDTVEMEGDGFQCLVQEGDKVKSGTPLIHFDREKIRAAGHADTVMLVVTEPANTVIQWKTGIEAESSKTVVASYS